MVSVGKRLALIDYKYSGVNNDKYYVDVTDSSGVGAFAISRVNEEQSLIAREKVYDSNRDLLTNQFRFGLAIFF